MRKLQLWNGLVIQWKSSAQFIMITIYQILMQHNTVKCKFPRLVILIKIYCSIILNISKVDQDLCWETAFSKLTKSFPTVESDHLRVKLFRLFCLLWWSEFAVQSWLWGRLCSVWQRYSLHNIIQKWQVLQQNSGKNT